ncbi:MAG: transglycosylase [Nitrospirae bacterium CG18_big_fil_WC_8_21_14_2_50_70_55]|nr:MAG: transglycosylase [Nitrospirae bacterium CG18_big_fil_WC_8_21_14_2_50_70_55]PJB96022.1 MAG: transglycosylase [Nitrospirae bacterium CG_4_9_14_0_8_um_filter_70_14]HBB41859.1 transglycosylase [Pseudomonadota bacterium]
MVRPTALLLLLVATWLPACHRAAVAPPPALERLAPEAWPPFADDLDRPSLLRACDQSLTYLRSLAPEATVVWGEQRLPAPRLLESVQAFCDLAGQDLTAENFGRALHERFDLYRAAGTDGRGRVVFTAYYEPEVAGSLTPSPDYPVPLYRPPEDLITVDLGRFRDEYRGRNLYGRLDGRSLVPYHDRAAIDGGALAGRGLELCWLKDPVDAFFLQIEGSGRLLLPDGTTRHLNFGSANGRPYRSIGKILIEAGELDAESISMQQVQEWLRDHPQRSAALFAANPSYVFFDLADDGPFGSLGVRLTPGRSIATDAALFPKGGICFITTDQPRLTGDGSAVAGWQPLARFTLNQDTGGAIRGAGRVDLFWGHGAAAAVSAGHLHHEGRLYWLLLKEG